MDIMKVHRELGEAFTSSVYIMFWRKFGFSVLLYKKPEIEVHSVSHLPEMIFQTDDFDIAFLALASDKLTLVVGEY